MLHRDDVPMEAMQELEAALQQKFPGFKVVCAGDQPRELPESVREAMQAVDEMHLRSLENGTCLDCGRKHPRPYPPEELADGWCVFTNVSTGDLMAIQCPVCDDKEKCPSRWRRIIRRLRKLCGLD